MIYITGDTHGDINMFKLSSKNFTESKGLSKEDYLIIAGDFGLLWKNEPDKTEYYLTKWLDNKQWTTLFIDGNHENHERIKALPTKKMFGSEVGVVSDSIYHLRRGHIYTIDKRKFLTIGGADSIDKHSRREGISWWPDELLSHKDINTCLDNLEIHDYSVDYIIAHTFPQDIINMFGLQTFDTLKEQDPVSKFLSHVVSITNFKHYYGGHLHLNKTISKYTCLYEDIIQLDS